MAETKIPPSSEDREGSNGDGAGSESDSSVGSSVSTSSSDSSSSTTSSSSSDSSSGISLPVESEPAPRTKNEVIVDSLPVKPIDFEVLSQHCIKTLGTISSVIGGKTIVIESAGVQHLSTSNPTGATADLLANSIAVDIDAPVVFEDRVPLGRISDTFGPVSRPFYTVRVDPQRNEVASRLKVGNLVFFVADLSTSVCARDLNSKGYDCSGLYDEETPLDKQDFSDDEAESSVKRALRNKTRRRPSTSLPKTKRRQPRFSNPRWPREGSTREQPSSQVWPPDSPLPPLQFRRATHDTQPSPTWLVPPPSNQALNPQSSPFLPALNNQPTSGDGFVPGYFPGQYSPYHQHPSSTPHSQNYYPSGNASFVPFPMQVHAPGQAPFLHPQFPNPWMPPPVHMAQNPHFIHGGGAPSLQAHERNDQQWCDSPSADTNGAAVQARTPNWMRPGR